MRANATLHRSSSTEGSRGRRGRLVLLAAVVATALGLTAAPSAEPSAGPGRPDLGPNVVIFDPSMPTSQIQATVDAIAAQQVPNQFGTQRYALLFEPGTYGTAAQPADLPGRLLHRGRRPRRARPATSSSTAPSTSTTSASTTRQLLHRAGQLLALAVEPDHQRRTAGFGCHDGRVLGGLAGRADAPGRTSTASTTLMDYCTPARSSPAAASSPTRGSTAARSSTARSSSSSSATARSTAGRTASGTRSSRASPAHRRSASRPRAVVRRPRTPRSPTSPVTREEPFLLRRRGRQLQRLRARRCSATRPGTSWDGGPTAGTSIPIDEFFIAKPTDGATGDQQRARARQEPASSRPASTTSTGPIKVKRAGHGRARPRLPDARPAATAPRR